ncbi:diguanylate cyclase domain-containing protein [Donghicola mangrovi]|uniref:Diguanylate cyclase n=1 Tax=Donghicola mangrovi TaxID=2729614 RepID=A0A850QD28_9RHOB|nr:diguanylate cyclase [Donghicola mangrovi]
MPFQFPELLDQLCPLHAILDVQGVVTGAGPTCRKILPDPIGQSVTDLFEMRRPTGITDASGLIRAGAGRLLLSPKRHPQIRLKGALFPVPQGAVLNLSFGLSMQDAVATYNLTQRDFPPTDLAVELLYLIEANALAMKAATDVTRRLQSARQRAESDSHTDALTGLLNRRGLENAVTKLRRHPCDVALVLMDLDRFKAVNDGLGHSAGDQVLRLVADLLRKHTRPDDILARCGGDEFTLLLHNVTDVDLGKRLDGLIAEIGTPIEIEGKTCGIGASAGWVLIPAQDLRNYDNIAEITDNALYEAKARGRGCHIRARIA